MLIAAIYLGLNMALTAVILWLARRENSTARTKPLQPLRTNNPLLSLFHGLYDLMDKVPLLRRSGRGDELDLFKALAITAFLIVLTNIIIMQPSPLVLLISLCFISSEVNIILLLHPLTKSIVGRK